jgi:hypothetical protein
VISPSQSRYLHRATQTQNNRRQTDIHTSSGIRTHDPSVRAGEDISCLRPRGHCDRHVQTLGEAKSTALWGCEAVQLGRYLPAIRRNLLPPSSRLKRKLRCEISTPVLVPLTALFPRDSHFYPENGGSGFLQNVDKYPVD